MFYLQFCIVWRKNKLGKTDNLKRTKVILNQITKLSQARSSSIRQTPRRANRNSTSRRTNISRKLWIQFHEKILQYSNEEYIWAWRIVPSKELKTTFRFVESLQRNIQRDSFHATFSLRRLPYVQAYVRRY